MRGTSREGELGADRAKPSGSAPWLLYGAYGFTGKLLAEEAVRRGHRPILAGRDPARLQELADGLERTFRLQDPLEVRSFALDDGRSLRSGLAGVSAVLHAAGPFIETARPMMEACLEARAHYLDITGEVPVFEAAFELSDQARERGIIVMPGVGMDVIPTDAAAALVAHILPDALRLELVLHSPGRPSTGTLQTIVEGLPGGLLVRRGGRLVRSSPGRKEFRRWVELGPEQATGPMSGKLGGRRSVAPYTWGDLATAWRTTGIPDITCYMTTPRTQVRMLPFLLPILRSLLSIAPIRRMARSFLSRGPDGPSPEAREQGRCRVWGRAEDAGGRVAEVVLEFPEAYRFTAEGGVRALERVLEGGLERAAGQGDLLEGGTLTPAGAFGPEWVLGLPGVRVVRGPEMIA
ncbi:saccharopine dehydrogenase NADP-binding domain-containing protein [soil metagenome]